MILVAITAEGQPATPVGGISETAAEVMAANANMYRMSGFEPPWIGYLAMQDDQVVGTCAFKSAPIDESVEIAYFTFPGFEGRGIATSMAKELIALARMTRPGVLVTAQTLAERNASNAILGKLGFKYAGQLLHPEDGEIWEWKLGEPNDAAQENPR